MRNNNGNNKGVWKSNIAIGLTLKDGFLTAAAVKNDTPSELLFVKRSDIEKMSLADFVNEVKLQLPQETEPLISIGFPSSSVSFSRFKVPYLKDGDLSGIVTMQAEARSPLPIDKIKYSWSLNDVENNQANITMTSVLRDNLSGFLTKVKNVSPDQIVIDCLGTFNATKELFGVSSQSIIISIEPPACKLMFTNGNLLVDCKTLDMNVDNLEQGGRFISKMFVQDFNSTLASLGFSSSLHPPILLLSDASDRMNSIANSLMSAGIDVKQVFVDKNKIAPGSSNSINDVYLYRTEIGLAIMALENSKSQFDIFEGIYAGKTLNSKKRWFMSLRWSAVAAAVLVVLFMLTFYLSDIAALKIYCSPLNAADPNANCSQLAARQKLLKTVALQRLNIVRFIDTISSVEHNGIVLNGINLKRHQQIKISGQAENDEQIYKFQEKLIDQKGINDVKIVNAQKDKKNGKMNFTISFNYKTFTRKKS